MEICIATEDELSERTADKMLASFGPRFTVTSRLRRSGSGYLRSRLRAFNEISTRIPVLLVTDLDQLACPSILIARWTMVPLPQNLLLRVAVREVESWLLADRHAIADYLAVPIAKVCRDPESLADPKSEILRLAARSRCRSIRSDMLPYRSAARVGLGYNSVLAKFVSDHWEPRRAIADSVSLGRAMTRIDGLRPRRLPNNVRPVVNHD